MKSKRTSNIEHRTSNIEQGSMRAHHRSVFGVRCSMFDVRFNSKSRAFSFAEVMFAVVILGIGFIMVAAVFPVAIKQTQSSGEENTAAAAARTAATAISNMRLQANNLLYSATATSTDPDWPADSVQTTPVFPPTVKNYFLPPATSPPPLVPQQVAIAPPAIMVPFTGVRWNQLQGNIVSATDPRYSYVAFYKRENNSAVAELIVVAVANRNHTMYDATSSVASGNSDVYGSTSSQLQVMAYTTPGSITSTAQANLEGANTGVFPDTITVTPGLSQTNTPLVSPEGGSLTLSPTANSIAQWVTALKPAGRYYTMGRAISGVGPGIPVPTFEINPGNSIYLAPPATGLWGTGGTADPLLVGDACTITPPTNPQPTVAYVQSLSATPNNPAGQISLSIDAAGSFRGPPAATTGAFVIIADDCPFDFTGNHGSATSLNYPIPNNSSSYQVGRLNGRIFRLGAQVVQNLDGSTPAVETFQLDPAFGMLPGVATIPSTILPAGYLYGPDTFPSPYTPRPTDVTATQGNNLPGCFTPNLTARCYIIGAGKDATGKITGSAQDLGVFATYFQVQ